MAQGSEIQGIEYLDSLIFQGSKGELNYLVLVIGMWVLDEAPDLEGLCAALFTGVLGWSKGSYILFWWMSGRILKMCSTLLIGTCKPPS